MTSEPDQSAVEIRRRRLRFRAWHRGTKEMDLILGGFIDAHGDALSETDMDFFEALMEVPEQDAYAWISGKRPVPARFDTAQMARLRAHATRPRTASGRD